MALLTVDRVAGGALVVVGLIAIWQSLQFPLGSLQRPGPAYMPLLLALLLILFGVILAATGSESGRFTAIVWDEWRHAVAIFVACAFAAWGLERLGYRLTMAAVLLFLLLVLERQRILVAVLLMAAVAWGSFFLFDTILRVPLPRGPFGI
ncbi:MAG: tripartite tricarboxylate transporter TctB family protein [Candidatus Rokuibacteriota bacterium]